jgi:hypothetical protein
MNFRTASIILTSAFGLGIWALPAQAITTAECSAKYQAAKTAGTLKGATWNQFRKSDCADDANPVKAATPATAQAAPATKAAAVAPSAANAVFPKAIDPKYAKEKPAAQRMKTCLDQYNVNKAASGNGGLNWIMKGGGYYSECNKRLKGA